MMKKLLLLISAAFFMLTSMGLKAQVTIDSIQVVNGIDCFGNFGDIAVHVDNDTNALGCDPLPNLPNSCGPLVSHQIKGFIQNGLNVQRKQSFKKPTNHF